MIRLLLVDDQPAVRRGMRMCLLLEADLEVIGEAGDGTEAIALAQRLRPDAILMDLAMPRMDGITATGRIHAALPDIPIIMLSMHDDNISRSRALAAGATAFLVKHETIATLPAVIRGVLAAAAPRASTNPTES